MSLDDLNATGSAVADEPITTTGDGGGGEPGTVSEPLPVEEPSSTPTEQPIETETPTTEQPVEQPLEPAGMPSPLPKELRALMADKELAAHPLVAGAIKQLQSAYDRLNAYTTHFPTVADAKKFAETFPGGLQDAIAAQTKAQEKDASDDIFYSRDPKQTYDLAASWQQDDPEAYRTLAHEALMVMMDRDPEGYRGIMLENLEGSLSQMQQAAFRRNDQEAAQRIGKVHEDIFGRKPGEQPRVDPRDNKHKEREEALNRDRATFTNGVAENFMTSSGSVAGDKVSTSVRSAVDKALANTKVNDGQKFDLAEKLYNSIDKKLRADKSLQNQISSIVSNGKRTGRFTREDQEKYVNAIYAKAVALLRADGPQFINDWTATFLNIKRTDINRREQAANRTGLTGGGSPNLGSTPLTGAQLLDMSQEELNKVPKQLIPGNWRELMRAERAKRQLV